MEMPLLLLLLKLLHLFQQLSVAWEATNLYLQKKLKLHTTSYSAPSDI